VTGEAGDVVNAKFVHHLLAMFLNGLDADAQLGGDLLVRAAFGDQLQHFGFAGREVVGPAPGGLSADEGFAALVAQALGNGRAEIGVASVRFANGFEQFVRGGLFDEISGSARLGQFLDVFVVTVGGKDQHFGGRNGAGDLPRGFQSVELRHGDVHDRDVRCEFAGELHGLAAIVRFTHDIDVTFGDQQRAQSLAHYGVIVGQNNSYLLHTFPGGNFFRATLQGNPVRILRQRFHKKVAGILYLAAQVRGTANTLLDYLAHLTDMGHNPTTKFFALEGNDAYR